MRTSVPFTMKINLTRQEYCDLLLMATLGERVICMDTSLDEYSEMQNSVTQTLSTFCRYADQFDVGDMVEFYDGECDLTEQAMELPLSLLEDYEENFVFWETGATLLARRDWSEIYSDEESEGMEEFERYRKFLDMRLRYFREWEEHGYDRLRIVEA